MPLTAAQQVKTHLVRTLSRRFGVGTPASSSASQDALGQCTEQVLRGQRACQSQVVSLCSAWLLSSVPR